MKKCYICNSDNEVHFHHLTPRKNGGSDDQRNKIDLCEKCHNEFESADWSELNQARRIYKTEKGHNSKSVKSFRSKKGNLVEWSKVYQEFREWELIPGGLKNYPYEGKIPK